MPLFTENIWILTRDPNPSSRTMRRAVKSMEALGLFDDGVKRSVQNCYRKGGGNKGKPSKSIINFVL